MKTAKIVENMGPANQDMDQVQPGQQAPSEPDSGAAVGQKGVVKGMKMKKKKITSIEDLKTAIASKNFPQKKY